MRRVLVVGSGGSGKTTLSVAISRALDLPLVHLDSLYWHPGWIATPKAEWKEAVAELVGRPAWVMDGNYGGTLDIRLAAADSVVFLDVAPVVCLWRVLKRRVAYHNRSRPSAPHGCNEVVTAEFLWWIWTYRRRRRPQLLARLEESRDEKQVFVLRGPEQVEAFLARIGGITTPRST